MIVEKMKENPRISQTENYDRELIHGDCLGELKKFDDNYFDLVYLDPPFNSKEFYNVIFNNISDAIKQDKDKKENEELDGETTAYKDTWIWTEEIEKEFNRLIDLLYIKNEKIVNLMNSLKGLFPPPIIGKYSPLAYYVYMIPRLVEMKRVLAKTGSIYLHCDWRTSHYLKIVMDAIFGYNNFRDEIIWCYSNSGRSMSFFPRKHDIIFFYAKSNKNKFYPQRISVSEQMLKQYPLIEEGTGKHYRNASRGKAGMYKEYSEKIIEDWWIDINSIGGRDTEERLGYPTQKPEALLERIILASTEKYVRVLDPFCGGGTTLDVAENLDRQWIGIDISVYAVGDGKDGGIRGVAFERMEAYADKMAYYKTRIRTSTNYPKEEKDMDSMSDNIIEEWIRDVYGAVESPEKKGRNDKGQDGIIYSKVGEKLLRIGIQITRQKDGKLTKFNGWVQQLKNGKYDLGIFVSDWYEGPTDSMKDTIKECGIYKDDNIIIDKIQMTTFRDVFRKKIVTIPGRQIKPGFSAITRRVYNPPVQPIKNTIAL